MKYPKNGKITPNMYINTLLNQLNTISVTAALVMNTTAVNNAAPLSNNGISMASETISIEIEKIKHIGIRSRM